jgi:hypothetical protein
LLVGPWLHGRFKQTNRSGELEYPDNASFAMETHMLRWFDHYLKGVDNGVERDPIVRYYVMGAVGEPEAPGNWWRTADDWPIATEPEAYYLRGGGKLAPTSSPVTDSSPEAATSWLSDPKQPMSIPGTAFPGAADARPFEAQPEIRTFTSEPLTELVEWTGLVRAELFVSSSAHDTDFIVRVTDVYPDGRSILIIDMIRRARYREGYDREVPMTPGKVCPLSFDVGWLSQIFNRGHRIRVTLASTGAPFYEPNPNTGHPLTIEPPDDVVVARNAVHHDQVHSSRILVHVPIGR